MLNTNIDTTNLNTNGRVKKALQIGDAFEKVFNTEKGIQLFRQKMLAMPDKYRLGETSRFKKMTNAQILAHLLSGQEEWNDKADKEIDLIFDDYRGSVFSKTVGKMIPGKPTIYVNTRYFDVMTIKACGSNAFHEWGHTMGFRHGGPNYRLSIAYFLNIVFEEIYDELIEGTSMDRQTWELVCNRKWYRLFIKKCYYVRAS